MDAPNAVLNNTSIEKNIQQDFNDYTRVTQVLYPFSGLDKINPHVVDNAARRGKRVHDVCEAIARGLGEWGVDEEIEGYVQSFKTY